MYYTTKAGKNLRTIITAVAILLTVANNKSFAQNAPQHTTAHYQDFGNTFNIGVGFIYANYLGASVPILMANYEFNVARDFTLAPFLGFASYTSGSSYYYGNDYYYYRETIIPVGVKGTYYFNRLLDLNPRWDLYGALSLGYIYDNVTWENGYEGAHDISTSPLFLDLHIGAEYHITRRVGLFGDLAFGNSSISTIGLAFHRW